MMRYCPAALRRGAIAVMLVLFASSASATGLTAFRGRAWLNHYYENPDPERFVASVFDLSRNRYFALPGHSMVGVGFMANLFGQNPERVDKWLLYCRSLPEKERRIVISALWYAGYPKGEAYLRLYADDTKKPKMRKIFERGLSSDSSMDHLVLESKSSLYLGWGMFLATGDEQILRRIFVAIPRIPNLTLRDRWWLACTLVEHDDVIAWCQAELPGQTAEVGDAMDLVLSAAQKVAVSD